MSLVMLVGILLTPGVLERYPVRATAECEGVPGVVNVTHAYLLEANNSQGIYATVCADGTAWWRHGKARDIPKLRREVGALARKWFVYDADQATTITNVYAIRIAKTYRDERTR